MGVLKRKMISMATIISGRRQIAVIARSHAKEYAASLQASRLAGRSIAEVGALGENPAQLRV
jgi:hypothetical protein